METAKNKKLFNIIMVAVIVIIIAGGIFAVGSIKDWFGQDTGFAKADSVTGIVSVERAGVSFELEKGASLQAGDVITVNEKAEIVIKAADNTFELAEKSCAKLTDAGEGLLQVELTVGEMFVTVADDETFGNVAAQGNSFVSEEGIFSVNVQTGSMGVNVFAGKVKATVGNDVLEAKAGQSISVVGDEATVGILKAESLNVFNIEKAMKAAKDVDLCFTEDELNKVIEDRDEANEEAEEDAEDGEVVEKDDDDKGDNNNNNGDSGNSGNSGNSSSGDSGTTTPPAATKLTCTIEIRCDTILNNMDNLTPGKEGYVPSSGVILKTTTVEFTEGETVFDVLKRVCTSKGIQLEYSWSPIYGSQYIEGINHLYEFDCGDLSGWCYKVNGWAPNYGVSVYELEDGDSIKFLYSCEGAGVDVGA